MKLLLLGISHQEIEDNSNKRGTITVHNKLKYTLYINIIYEYMGTVPIC